MITKQKIKKCVILMIIMIGLGLLCFFHAWLNPIIIKMFVNEFEVVSSEDNMLVHFIDVEQADAVAVNLPDGKILLIDSGCEEFNSTYSKYLKENVVHTQRTDYIDYLVLSHADMDHVGGTLKLLKNFDIGTVFMPKVGSSSAGYQEILTYVKTNCNYRILGDEFTIGNDDYQIRFLKQLADSNTNDASQVIKLECENKSFLFTGDISSSIEDEYISMYGSELDADVLKVAHHGSKTATSQAFLNEVTPEYAVISVGYNSYGHPTDEVLNNLKNCDAEVLRTDKLGNILFVVGEDYNLKHLDGIYYITNLTLDYRYLVLVINIVLLFSGVIVVVKREKKSTKQGK